MLLSDCKVATKSFSLVPPKLQHQQTISNVISFVVYGHQNTREYILESNRFYFSLNILLIPVVAALTFKAKFTAESKKSATLAKSSSTNPLDVSAGVPARSWSS